MPNERHSGTRRDPGSGMCVDWIMKNLRANLNDLLTVSSKGAIHIGLLGRGIGASLSPIMHRREGARQGLDYHYHLIDFDALGLADGDLADVLTLLETIGFTGCNVTHPFKQTIIALLDDLAPDAAAIGAVNTVILGDGRRRGHNTDCWGFAESFRQGLPDVPRRSVLQIGAGGAGVAVARALYDLGVDHIDIVDADAGRAQTLMRRLDAAGLSVAVMDRPEDAIPRADGIVNATPIGMDKYPGSPIDLALIDPRLWVADVIYFPRRTALIQHAAACGCQTLPGAGMAIYQAVKAFELFTQRAPSREHMAQVFEATA